MNPAVHVLDIGDNEVRIRQNLLDFLPVSAECGFTAGMDSLFLARLKQLRHKIALNQRFPSGYGNAPAGTVVIAPVLSDLLHAVFHGHRLPPLLDRVRRTRLIAGQAVGACTPVD